MSKQGFVVIFGAVILCLAGFFYWNQQSSLNSVSTDTLEFSSESTTQSTPSAVNTDMEVLQKNKSPHLSGVIHSVTSGGGYIFLGVERQSGDQIFIATGRTDLDFETGQSIQWIDARLAKNYVSHALDKTFKQLYFVTFEAEAFNPELLMNEGRVLNIVEQNQLTFIDVDGNEELITLVIDSYKLNQELTAGALISWTAPEVTSHSVDSKSSQKKSNVHVDQIRILKK